MNNYQCPKCKIVVQSNSTPNSINCSSGGNHNWNNLHEVGTHDYQCKKCNTHIKSNSTPGSINCPSGGNHNWTKLT
jgi:DNA-directed RNA polymerase subunit RPC12/RpoP